MGKEIERKFLVDVEKWNYQGKQSKISQGYLFNDNNGVVRIRLCETKHNKYALLTIKSSTENITRDEFEYEIPYSDGLELISKCSHKIEKTRYFLKGWEIDVFEGDNKGLVVAEIELNDENQEFIKPDWVLEEVSSKSRYYNSNLIIYPYNLW